LTFIYLIIRLSDLCEYCEYNRELKHELFDAAVYFNYTSLFDVMNIIVEKHFKTFLEKIKNADKVKAENTIEKIEKSNVINEHKKIADIQRNSYNEMKNDIQLISESILI
jgi:D-ribose pyranose/furanose isomerase RbsD